MIRLCSLEDIPAGEGLRVVGPVPLAVFQVDGDAFVIDDACSHQAASLSDGYLEGCWVECPLHEAFFSLRTGEPSGPPAKKPVRTYPALVSDGVVYADLSPVTVEAVAGAVVEAIGGEAEVA